MREFIKLTDLFEVKCKICGSIDVDLYTDNCNQCGDSISATCNNCKNRYCYHDFKQKGAI